MNISLERLMGFANSRRWEAQWIWVPGVDPKKENTYALFRRTMTVSQAAGTRIFISADTRYRLYVNGEFVGQGPPLSMPFFQYYNEHDLSAVLRAGENCIGVVVYHLGTLAQARGGLLAEVVDREGRMVVGTEQTWKGTICKAWQANTYRAVMNVLAPFQEHFDARAFPEGFAACGFDDAAWGQAEVIKGRIDSRVPMAGPWCQMVPRDIPEMAEKEMRAERIEQAGEAIALNNRMRPEDLSITLSQGMVELKRAEMKLVESLVSGEGAAEFRCSSEPLKDPGADGIYEPCVVLDFGKVVTGYFELEVEGAAGAAVEIGYVERLVDGQFNNAIEGQFADRYVMKAGRQRFVPFAWRAFRYVKLRFREAYEGVKVHAAKAIVSTYPFEERGGFSSGDAMLNRIFEISRYTVRLCSHEALMDTPWREAAQWLGDVAAVTQPAIHACFGDTAITGKFLRQAAANQYPVGLISNTSNAVKGTMDWTIPDYSLWWIIGLWEQYMYTGERRWIDAFYPQMMRIVQAHLVHTNERGLVENMPLWVFVDWADIDKRGECAAYNAIFYGALEIVEQMAALRRDEHTGAAASTIRAAMKANFSERLFDKTRGLLADARLAEGLSEKTSEQANLAAIRFGLIDDAPAKAIVAKLFDGPPRPDVTEAQPFFMVVVLQGLQHLGRMDLALKLMRDRWGGRMVERGATSTYEEWGINGSRRSGRYEPYMRTLSHAWSACPAEFLIRNLIGLEIIAPGCRKIRLSPTKTDFDYDMAFPTPLGPVRVTWKKAAMHVVIPAGIEAVGDGSF